MPANFPTSPTIGDRHTIADKTWEWTGSVWDLVVSTNTLQFSGEDSAVITVNLTANEELRIVGDGQSISTTGNAGDSATSTLQISLNKTIDVNEIISSDSTLVTIVDGLATPLLTSLDSSAVQVNDGINVRGSLTLENGVSVDAILDENNLASDSDTALATQQSIKAYVDSQVTSGVSGGTLTFVGDDSTGSTLNIGNTLSIVGGNSVSSSVTNDTVTLELDKDINVNTISSGDSTSVTVNDGLIVTGNLSFDGGVSVSTILDEDTLSSDSDTALATQQSIKAYVDSQITATNTLKIGDDASSEISLDLDTTLNVQGGNSITSSVTGDTLTVALNDSITVDDIAAKDSTAININSPIQVSGNINTDTSLTVAGYTVNQILDEDNMVSNSDTALATQQSIRQYVQTTVNSSVSSLSQTIQVSDDASTVLELDLQDDTLSFQGGNSITSSIIGDTVQFALDSDIVVNSISSSDSTSVRINDSIETNGVVVNGNISATGNLSVTGNTTIDGDLTVSGTTTYIETTNTKVSDPLLLLNNGNSGGADVDSGIMVERGSAGNNAVFYWNEGEDVFKAVTTTSSESDVAITDTALANIRVAEPSNSSDAATKNYVDTEIAGLSTTIKFADDTSSVLTADLQNDTVSIAGGNSITSSITGDTITLALNSSIDVNEISSTDSTSVTVNDGLIVTGNFSFDGGVAVNTILDEDNMASNSDTALATQQSIKSYVDNAVAGGVGLLGTNIQLGYPTDSSTYPVGAINTLTPTHTVTDSIDDLNEVILNVYNSTYVRSVNFTADNTVGGAGLVVTLTITSVGNADRYDITWGDGSTTLGTTDTTPTHTYSSNVGSPFDVTVRAYASGGEGTGSEATETKENYITIFTANPSVDFDIYAASSGGSPITKCDLGSTVYLENTTTNTTGVTATFTIDWGDGITETISANGDPGGVDGTRLSHTYDRPDAGDSSTTLVGGGDLRFQPRLTLLSHSTANPTEIPKSSSLKYFYVYAEHDPLLTVDGSVIRGINEEATSGFPVTFNNDTISDPGAYSVFNTNSGSNTYTWNFGEGDGNITVNIGSGSPGDTGVDRSNTFNLSSGEQAAGTTQTYTTTLTINNGHSNSPFSTNLNIIVEPDVRANISATADTVSTGSSDNSLTLYDHTDLDGNNRASVTFTNTSQNNDDNEYDFFNDSTDVLTVQEKSPPVPPDPGSTLQALTKNFSGTSVGSFTTDFKVTGTPDTIHQTDSETVTFTMKAVPSAPADLSTKSITLSDSAQFTNTPKLCAGFDDNTSSFTSLTAGDSLNTTTVRRYTSGTIDTSTASNFYNGASGTLTAAINASADGQKTFTSSENETGTFTSLVVTSNPDYDTVDSSYPQRFYLVASAKITKALTGYTVGVNAQRLEHSATGNTNLVYVVRDDITATPTTTIGTVSQDTQGTLRYISGVPYYNTGSPALGISGTTVANFTGQAYADISNPHEIDNGTQITGSGSVIDDTDYTYANVDGSSTMLTGGIPNTDTGVSSAYTLGDLTVDITSSSVFSRRKIQARSRNVNGTGSYSQDDTIISVFTASPTGLNLENGGITVSDSLGATYDDDAVRIADFIAETTDTPSFSGATNFYTNDVWSGAESVSGTQEATVIPSSTSAGTISHDVTDYSTGYLPVGPDRSSDTGAQYFTIAFRRTTMANFNITLTGTVSGCFIAAPGTAIDSASTLNGWLDAGITYGGSGVPGADTGNGGNGSNGCAFTSGDRIQDGVSYSNQTFTLTLGSENATNATGNVVLVRFKLESGDSLTAVSIA